MALATAERLTFTYPDAALPAVEAVSVSVEAGEVVALLGPSGSGKSTLLRAFAGLVPHFHGGRFAGRVTVGGFDTRSATPAQLTTLVASLFQDPEDQVVMTRVANEVSFGLENVGTPPAEIRARAVAALAAVDAAHLAERDVRQLSSGELQRVCLASALALEPRVLLLDEPTSQLDPRAAEGLVELAVERARSDGVATVVSEQRPGRVLDAADRVLFMEAGRLVLDAPAPEALAWLACHRPDYCGDLPAGGQAPLGAGEHICLLDDVSFAYRRGVAVLRAARLAVRRGEIVALTGTNGSGKTTLAKLAAGLLEPDEGVVRRAGRAAYLSQDPGRYLVAERVEDEVALGVRGDRPRARAALARVGLAGLERRHPRDLSSGERERLGLACVLVTEPDLLVLDEPTRGVDPERKRALAGLLRADAASRGTLVVTHDLGFADAVADRRVSLDGARELVHA